MQPLLRLEPVTRTEPVAGHPRVWLAPADELSPRPAPRLEWCNVASSPSASTRGSPKCDNFHVFVHLCGKEKAVIGASLAEVRENARKTFELPLELDLALADRAGALLLDDEDLALTLQSEHRVYLRLSRAALPDLEHRVQELEQLKLIFLNDQLHTLSQEQLRLKHELKDLRREVGAVSIHGSPKSSPARSPPTLTRLAGIEEQDVGAELPLTVLQKSVEDMACRLEEAFNSCRELLDENNVLRSPPTEGPLSQRVDHVAKALDELKVQVSDQIQVVADHLVSRLAEHTAKLQCQLLAGFKRQKLACEEAFELRSQQVDQSFELFNSDFSSLSSDVLMLAQRLKQEITLREEGDSQLRDDFREALQKEVGARLLSDQLLKGDLAAETAARNKAIEELRHAVLPVTPEGSYVCRP